MSLSKKDPSLRVAANDPHLVSLGGDRLSTAVTIHNIPVGDCTIGSSLQCSVSLSGTGVMPVHCTIYRSEENQVTLVPERSARVLIDNQLIKNEVDLRQGAMITIGDSYYLRYNNPAEALQMRSAMEDISGKKIPHHLNYFYETNVDNPTKTRHYDTSTRSYYDNLKKTGSSVDLIEWQCPKVFTADLVTVKMSAKDVLGQKYASFAKNLAEHYHNNKNVNILNTAFNDNSNVNLKNSLHKSKELLSKENCSSMDLKSNDLQHFIAETKIGEKDPLEDMLNICAEYTDRQDRSYGGNNSNTSSPIVQNRIKTNGSLPRDKKSPFSHEFQSPFNGSSNSLSQSPKSSGYENVFSLHQNSVEVVANYMTSGYENVKLVAHSPRTKIRTNCLSPKKDFSANNSTFTQNPTEIEKSATNCRDLIKNFEVNFQKDIETIEESSKTSLCNENKRSKKNINNLTIDIESIALPYKSHSIFKQLTQSPRVVNKTEAVDRGRLSGTHPNPSSNEELQEEREDLLQRIQSLKTELSSLQNQDNETLIEMDMEHALITEELRSQQKNKLGLQREYQLLKQKIHRLEAQRNATRVMEENQQSKLKYSIEMKENQLEKLHGLMNQKLDNKFLKDELSKVRESLENDKKYFEDLEFQYLEGESEWQSYRDDLSLEEQTLNKKIEECQLSIDNLEKQKYNSSCNISAKQRRVSNHLISLIKELQQCDEQFNLLEKKLSAKISLKPLFPEEHQTTFASQTKIMESLFGSTEMLYRKTNNEDLMSKSVNENMFYNNNIEILKNELTVNIASNVIDNVDLKEDTCKVYDPIYILEKQQQLFSTRKELYDLNYERRKIEELLNKISFDPEQRRIVSTQKGHAIIKNNELTSLSRAQSQKNQGASPSSTCSPSLPDTRPDQSSKSSPNVISKSLNEMSISSFNSPKSSYLEDKCPSSLLLNELSLQKDSSSISFYRKNTQKQMQQRPLTRYLPNFAEDLDLKRHIESAGHPITLCPHVFLDTYSCRGYLHKLGSTFHTWSKRWFVLDRRRTALIYYAEKSERKPRGGAYFSSIVEVYMDHLNSSKSGRTHSTFIVKTKKRSYYLQASSDTAARIWIDAIITGAQGNIDY